MTWQHSKNAATATALSSWEQIEKRIARGKLRADEQAELWDPLFLSVAQIEELLARVPKIAL